MLSWRSPISWLQSANWDCCPPSIRHTTPRCDLLGAAAPPCLRRQFRVKRSSVKKIYKNREKDGRIFSVGCLTPNSTPIPSALALLQQKRERQIEGEMETLQFSRLLCSVGTPRRRPSSCGPGCLQEDRSSCSTPTFYYFFFSHPPLLTGNLLGWLPSLCGWWLCHAPCAEESETLAAVRKKKPTSASEHASSTQKIYDEGSLGKLPGL